MFPDSAGNPAWPTVRKIIVLCLFSSSVALVYTSVKSFGSTETSEVVHCRTVNSKETLQMMGFTEVTCPTVLMAKHMQLMYKEKTIPKLVLSPTSYTFR